MVIDKDTILQIMPKAPVDRASSLAFVISKYGAKMGLRTPSALAIFLGNIAHESYQLQKLKEGDNPQGTYLKSKKYFPYIGFGPMQVTHKTNYKLVSQELYGDDRFVTSPNSIFNDSNALMMGSLIWWSQNYSTNYQNFRTYADSGNAKAIAHIINTGNKDGTKKDKETGKIIYVAKAVPERLFFVSKAIEAMKKKIYKVRFKAATNFTLMPLWDYLHRLSDFYKTKK